MKSRFWRLSVICIGLIYLINLGAIVINYNDIFTPESITSRRDQDGNALKSRKYQSTPRSSNNILKDGNDKRNEPQGTRNPSKEFHYEDVSSDLSVQHVLEKEATPIPKKTANLQDHLSSENPTTLAGREISFSSDVNGFPVNYSKTEVNNTETIGLGSFHIEVMVGKWNLSILLDGNEIFHEEVKQSDIKFMRRGGLYLLVLHQSRGTIMHSSRHRSFEEGGDKDLFLILKGIQPGRIIILASLFDSFGHLSDEVEEYLRKQGSKVIIDMTLGDRWAWVWSKDQRTWAESSAFSTHPYNLYYQGGPLRMHAHPIVTESRQCLQWPKGELWDRRRTFCDLYEGYGRLCSCKQPSFTAWPILHSEQESIPTVIVASQRPLCLYRCLSRLMEVSGSDPSRTLVVADGDLKGGLKEVEDLVRLYGIKFQPHDAGVNNVTVRITRHYKKVFQDGFHFFPHANKIIILEEDLYVSDDFYGYFQQVAPILDRDPSLYCASAWNDLGIRKAASDPTVVLRSETMAGLGWILTKSIYYEIIDKWPSSNAFTDWDIWMRSDEQRKGRECLIPEVPRTSHFGITGAHLTAYFQSTYFSHYALNKQSPVTLQGLDRLVLDEYDSLLNETISQGKHLDGGALNPCMPDLIPANSNTTHVMWIMMNEAADNYTLTGVFKCLGLWDLDVRGGHQFLWRIRLEGSPLFIIGWPLSPFSALKPNEVNVMRRADPKKIESDPPVYRILNRQDKT